MEGLWMTKNDLDIEALIPTVPVQSERPTAPANILESIERTKGIECTERYFRMMKYTRPTFLERIKHIKIIPADQIIPNRELVPAKLITPNLSIEKDLVNTWKEQLSRQKTEVHLPALGPDIPTTVDRNHTINYKRD